MTASPPPASNAAIARIIGTQVCMHTAWTGARMAAPLWALSLGHSVAATGFLVALFALAQIFLSLPVGRYVDRHGMRGPLCLAVVSAIAGGGVAALWPGYLALCLCAVLTGGAVGTSMISLQRHLGQVAGTPQRLRQAFSWLSVAPAVANLIGPVTAGVLIDMAGFPVAFAFLAAVPGCAWWLVRTSREETPGTARQSQPGSVLELLRDAPVRRILLLNLLMSAGWDLHGFMVPLLGHERGLPASVIGSILGAFAIAAALSRMAMPFLAARVRDAVLVAVALVSAGLVILLYPLAETAPLMMLGSALMGATLGIVQPLVIGLLHYHAPAARMGEALAVRLILISVSAVSMPLLLGVAGSVIGVSAVFWTVGAVLATGSRLGLTLPPPGASERP